MAGSPPCDLYHFGLTKSYKATVFVDQLRWLLTMLSNLIVKKRV